MSTDLFEPVELPGLFLYVYVTSEKTTSTTSRELLVMVAGFPDNTESAWGRDGITSLSQHYDVLAVCLPGYSKLPPRAWGYDFEELIKMLHATINHIVETTNRKTNTFFLIGHDWGSIVSQLYQKTYPDLVKKLCLMLVKMFQDIFCFFCTSLGLQLHIFSHKLFPSPLISPINISPTKGEKVYRSRKEINVLLCYPYLHLFRALASKNSPLTSITYPSCPLLFLYGKEKAAMFHGEKFIQKILKDGGGEVVRGEEVGEEVAKRRSFAVEVAGGHWLFRQRTNFCIKVLTSFFK